MAGDHQRGGVRAEGIGLVKLSRSLSVEVNLQRFHAQSVNGHDMVLIDYSVIQFTNRADVVLAKYGPGDLGVTNCLDFYVEYPVPPD